MTEEEVAQGEVEAAIEVVAVDEEAEVEDQAQKVDRKSSSWATHSSYTAQENRH